MKRALLLLLAWSATELTLLLIWCADKVLDAVLLLPVIPGFIFHPASRFARLVTRFSRWSRRSVVEAMARAGIPR